MKRVIVAAALAMASQSGAAQEQPLLTNEEIQSLTQGTDLGAPPVDFGRMKRNAEKAIRNQLIDPASAEFEWPNGFVEGWWQPSFSKKKISGYWTCGFVNARNRMGGYVGRAAFVIVMRDVDSSTFVDMDSGTDRFPRVGRSCLKSGSALPPAPPEFADPVTTSPSAVISVADELSKLAKLRADGVITQEEFDAQKAKLLGQ